MSYDPRFPHEDAEFVELDAAEAALRRARLDAAAARAKAGDTAAKARLAAGRLSEILGDLQGARARYEAAQLAAPRAVAPLRGLGRVSEQAGDFQAAASYWTRETDLGPTADERRELLLARAEVELLSGAAETALATLAAAQKFTRDDARLPLARAEASLAAGRIADLRDALRPLEARPEGELGAAVLAFRAALLDRDGDAVGALAKLREAENVGGAFAALLGERARLGSAGASPDLEATAWETLARPSPPGAVRTVLTRRAARVRHLAGGDPKTALSLLEDLPNAVPVDSARLDAAEAVGDSDAALLAAVALAERAPGIAAAALWRAARALGADGKAEAALGVLTRAIEIGPDFLPARTERDEILRAQGPRVLADAWMERGPADALRAAAVLLSAGGDLESALRALQKAREGGATSPSQDLAAATLAQMVGDAAAAAGYLARVAEASPAGEAAQAMWIAVGALEERAGLDPKEAYKKALPARAARLALRRKVAGVAQAAASAANAEAEEIGTLEARATSLVEEGAAQERASDTEAALRAYDGALALDPASIRASAARARLLATADPARAAAALEELAARAPTPALTAPLLVRAAIRARDVDRTVAQARLREALALAPDDLALGELAASMGAGGGARARAMRAGLEAEKGPVPLERWIEAAEAFESSATEPDDFAEAASLYRRAIELAPERADVEEALVRTLIKAGELPSVTEQLLGEARAAKDDAARASAFERLADFDGAVRGDPASAAIAWAEVQAIRPAHATSLRALERHLTGTGRRDDLLPILEALAEASEDAQDEVAFARRAARIKRLEQGPTAIDDPDLARRVLERGPSRWAFRALEADARVTRSDEALADVTFQLAEASEGPTRVAHLVAAGEANLRLARRAEARQAFQSVLEIDPVHSLALLRLAALADDAGDPLAAAAAWEASGRSAEDGSRGAGDLHRAAVLVLEAGDDRRALGLLEAALERDPNHVEAIDLAARLHEEAGNAPEAERLLERRLGLGGAPAALAALAERRADLLVTLDRRLEARATLHMALGYAPDDVALLWRIADMAAEDGAPTERADALLEIARRVTDSVEIQTAFLDLGRLYVRDLPDDRRAEACFRRVLQQNPDEPQALEELASLGLRVGNIQLALEATERLTHQESDPKDRARHFRMLMRIQEEGLRDDRRAEAALREARGLDPTDVDTIDAGITFYRKRGGGPPLALWLDLAATSLRDSLAQSPEDVDGYRALARVLAGLGRADAERAARAVAATLGDATATEEAALASSPPPAPAALARDRVVDHLSPPGLPGALREVFARLHEVFLALVPADPKVHGASRADKVAPRDAVHVLASRIAQSMGLEELDVYLVAADRPDIVLPGRPAALVVSRSTIEAADPIERAFHLGRAAFLARTGLAAPLLLHPDDLGTLLVGLVRSFDPRFPVDPKRVAAVDEAGRRISKHLPRRDRDTVLPFVLEAAGERALDGAAVRTAIKAAADAAGLVACGRIDAALRAIARESGVSTATEVARSPRGAALLRFAVSDGYLEALRLASTK